MKTMVEALCSDACEGRKPGTKGGLAARRLIVDQLRHDGLEPFEQAVPGCRGANVIARLPGEIDRWVLVGAHYDHLGREGGKIYRGADDNAAAVAILLEVSKQLSARRPAGRGVLLCAFDGEEPPYFMSGAMGSQFFVKHASVPLDTIDMMVCMDLVGHAFGGEELPEQVRSSMFALGAERSEGTARHVDAIAASEPGVVMRRADAEVIPPLSDYDPFWRRRVPFLFLTSGRSRYYHTPQDTPDRLDYGKMAATARWLERFVRETCARPPGKVGFLPDVRDDAATLRSVVALTEHLSVFSEQAQQGQELAFSLLSSCDSQGSLPPERRAEAQMLVGLLESKLALSLSVIPRGTTRSPRCQVRSPSTTTPAAARARRPSAGSAIARCRTPRSTSSPRPRRGRASRSSGRPRASPSLPSSTPQASRTAPAASRIASPR